MNNRTKRDLKFWEFFSSDNVSRAFLLKEEHDHAQRLEEKIKSIKPKESGKSITRYLKGKLYRKGKYHM